MEPCYSLNKSIKLLLLLINFVFMIWRVNESIRRKNSTSLSRTLPLHHTLETILLNLKDFAIVTLNKRQIMQPVPLLFTSAHRSLFVFFVFISCSSSFFFE